MAPRGPAKVGNVTDENTERLLTPHQVAERSGWTGRLAR